MPFRSVNAHLDDTTLLLLLEGDLSPRARRRAESHLAECPACARRRHSFALTDGFLTDDGAEPGPGVRGGEDAARDQLAAGLASLAQTARSHWWLRARTSGVLRLRVLLRVAAVCLLMALAVIFRQLDLPLQDRMAVYEETGPKPDHALTPGAANPVSLTEVCSRNDDDLDPQLPLEKRRAVFRAYGLNERAARAYQVDYLINPQLGGSDAMENLWPEPYHATVWNAKAKDALEARLHGLVCGGQIDLVVAQQELSTDWIAAYKKYFHASRPVSTVARSVESTPR